MHEAHQRILKMRCTDKVRRRLSSWQISYPIEVALFAAARLALESRSESMTMLPVLPRANLPFFCLYRGPGQLSSARVLQDKTSNSAEDCRRQRRVCFSRLSRREQEAAQLSDDADTTRPWSFEIPSFDEILESEDWPGLVKNWSTFWSMFLNWVQGWGNLVLLERDDLEEMTMTQENLAWLQLQIHEREKVENVIDTVIAKIPELLAFGYPVPESIPGKKPWHIGHWKTQYFEDHLGRTQWRRQETMGLTNLFSAGSEVASEETEVTPAPINGAPWDNWNAWEFRVFMEKKRAHRRQQADFARRQAELGQFDQLTVSHLTDSRLVDSSPIYPALQRDATHEENMERLRMYGKAVDPEKIPLKILDPLERADAFAEGVHYVPDTLDFIRSIGHLTESQEDLLGPGDDNVPSATMEEEFLDTQGGPLEAAFGADSEETFDVAEEDLDFGTTDLEDDLE